MESRYAIGERETISMNDTKVIISCEGTKRTLPLPFGICLSKSQAYKIREAMEAFLGSEAVYGWTTVHMDKEESTSNQKPIDWHAPGKSSSETG